MEFQAAAIQTQASGEMIGKFEGLWYVDSKSVHANSRGMTTVLTRRGRDLGAGVHDVALRVDFSNVRIRRDEGWLGDSRAWRVEVSPHRRPTFKVPAKVEGKVGEEISFEVGVTNPDPDTFTLVAGDMPLGALFENGRFSWTPTKEFQGAWRPRFAISNGSHSAEVGVLEEEFREIDT